QRAAGYRSRLDLDRIRSQHQVRQQHDQRAEPDPDGWSPPRAIPLGTAFTVPAGFGAAFIVSCHHSGALRTWTMSSLYRRRLTSSALTRPETRTTTAAQISVEARTAVGTRNTSVDTACAMMLANPSPISAPSGSAATTWTPSSDSSRDATSRWRKPSTLSTPR